MLAGTVFAGRTVHAMDDPRLAPVLAQNLTGEGEHAILHEVLGADGTPLSVSGLAVVELPEEFYDVASGAMYPSSVYWIVGEAGVYELGEYASKNLRLGQPLGWFDASAPQASEEMTSLTLLDRMIGLGAFENADMVREAEEMILNSVVVAYTDYLTR